MHVYDMYTQNRMEQSLSHWRYGFDYSLFKTRFISILIDIDKLELTEYSIKHSWCGPMHTLPASCTRPQPVQYKFDYMAQERERSAKLLASCQAAAFYLVHYNKYSNGPSMLFLNIW